MVMAVPVRAGRNEVALEFYTPGRSAGLIVSAIGLAGVVGLFFVVSRARE
jgi:hypothetical protein